MRALVTGGAGFIGSHLTRALLKASDVVTVLDDLSEGDERAVPDDANLIVGDIRDPEAVEVAMKNVDTVFHLAAKRAVHRSIDDPTYTTDVNVNGTLNVFHAAAEMGVRRVVFASSSSVYGNQDAYPSREYARLRPRSPYAVSKLYGETLGDMMGRTTGTEFVSLRYFNVYGPGQKAGAYAAVVPLFISALKTGAQPIIHGTGEQRRDFTYITDAVRATLSAADAPQSLSGAFNVGGGKPHSINELLKILADIMGVNPNPSYEGTRRGDVKHTGASLSRSFAELDYHPRVGLEEGLRRTLADLRSC